MDRQLKSALKESFCPPKTREKEKFINSISYPKARFSEVLFSQIGFIRKRVWILFVIGVCFAFFYSVFANIPTSITTTVSAILPLFSLCIFTEIHRSVACNMAETELACKYNLSKITLMRLGILGTVSFVMLVLLVIFAGKNNFGTLRNAIYIAVPYLLSTYISLGIILKFSSKETIYVCTAVCGGVSISMIMVYNFYQFIYNIQFIKFWAGSFFVLIILTFISIVKFLKLQEELQWSLL